MIKIEFPKEKVKIQQHKDVHEVFDAIRKKWLLLTPEEWVRQHILQYLLLTKKYPASLIAIEKEIKLAGLKKRCDIVVYNRKSEPWMIIECKEMKVAVSENTLDQILRYHISLSAQYLIITNGSYCFGFEKKEGQFTEIDCFPDFEI
jgi:predicted type IV restriction endonuclease